MTLMYYTGSNLINSYLKLSSFKLGITWISVSTKVIDVLLVMKYSYARDQYFNCTRIYMFLIQNDKSVSTQILQHRRNRL